ncbi:MAG: hypothetical protein EHM17_13695 [Verrucomicrobiaceae bacterium]|nr:MAG: hypothetical protein EHM17_15195 [Verrucomicrobiaceae bacterium]RPJ32260.1 MAG: hypothetical protein EHM17_13695 [Verrucomicrobiaceae bacterium]
MKTIPCTLFVCAAALLSAKAQPAVAAMQMRDVASQEELLLERRKALQIDPMKHLATATGEDPSKANQPTDILAESDIISFRGLATLVPKRAILQTPQSYAGHVKMEPGARFVSWREFYALNRGWITTVEVSREQAEGNAPFAEETRKFLGTNRNLVVATFKGGPVSVLPLKEPAPETAMQTPTP